MAYHLSFVITHPSRATDTHTQADRSAARCTDIGKACMHQHLHAHSLLFTTCANLRLLSRSGTFFFFPLPVCRKEVTYFLCQHAATNMQTVGWMTARRESRRSKNTSAAFRCQSPAGVSHPGEALSRAGAGRHGEEDGVCWRPRSLIWLSAALHVPRESRRARREGKRRNRRDRHGEIMLQELA